MPPVDANGSSAPHGRSLLLPSPGIGLDTTDEERGRCFYGQSSYSYFQLLDFLTFKHLELLTMFQGLQPYKPNEQKNNGNPYKF